MRLEEFHFSMRLECVALFKAYPRLVLSAHTPALCVDSQRRPLVMPFPFFGAKERDDHLHTAKRFLVETLTITEKLLDGFPIPGAKGTIGAALHFITEAEVCTGVNLCYFSIFIAVTENRRERRTLCQTERAYPGAPKSTHSASSWQNEGGYTS